MGCSVCDEIMSQVAWIVDGKLNAEYGDRHIPRAVREIRIQNAIVAVVRPLVDGLKGD